MANNYKIRLSDPQGGESDSHVVVRDSLTKDELLDYLGDLLPYEKDEDEPLRTISWEVQAYLLGEEDEDGDCEETLLHKFDFLIDPPEPECAEDCTHTWTPTGGLETNPGWVSGRQGLEFREICVNCDLLRKTNHWDSFRNEPSEIISYPEEF